MPPANRSRPLLPRPGARFACFNDGLCCTDIHALGPITRTEARTLRALIEGSVHHHEGVDAPCMRPGADGACAQREKGLCGVHARHGAQAKPEGCRRFPYGLLSTPEGGRVTTEHRCSCRTLGDRPPLDLADAEASLRGARGALEVDHRAPARVPWSAGRTVSFARYRETEARLLADLLAGARAEDVLRATALPDLTRGAWPVLAAEFYDLVDGSAGGVALAWFADALLHLCQGLNPPRRERPWAPSFEKALARSPTCEDPEQVVNDWIADELWMMRWLDWHCTFDVARAELATRLGLVRQMAGLLEAGGLRADQAAAEAVMIAEVGALNEQWSDIVDRIANDPSPVREAFA